jgi:preprotein translocase subunit YajC
MIMEFIKRDNEIFFDIMTGKQLSIIPFTLGSLILLHYYLIQRPQEIRQKRTPTL